LQGLQASTWDAGGREREVLVDFVVRCDVAELVGESPAMERLRQAAMAASRSRSTVLVTGETGTGKTLIARAIHRLSPGREGDLVHVDCSALAPSLIESELFGHERGAFTGALSPRAGRFEMAEDGDILLDEIGDLDPLLQAKFLRVLEDRAFERVGGSRTLAMRARVIAATNRDLDSDVRAGRFRADLYHRLRVVHIHVPPLRERAGDLPCLGECLLARLAVELDLPPAGLSDDGLDALAAHDWPGNVRELRNLLESILVLQRPLRIERQHVVEGLGGRAQCEECPATSPAAARPVQGLRAAEVSAERAELIRLLVETGGNVARVARRMGIPRTTLRHRIDRHGLGGHIRRD
jgi:transcriptional regulator with GAF, ATPase, and Fis domain